MNYIAILEKGYETYRYRLADDDETIVRTGDGTILMDRNTGMSSRCVLSDDLVDCDKVTYMSDFLIDYYLNRWEGQDELEEDFPIVEKKINKYIAGE